MTPRTPPLRLDPQFTHRVSTGTATLLVGDEDSFVLDSPLAMDTVRLIDGVSSSVDIAEALRDVHPPEVVHFLLLKLEQEGLVHPIPEEEGRPSSHELDAEGWTGELARELAEAWAARGPEGAIRIRAAGRHGDPIPVLLTDDYLRADLREMREHLIPDGEPFLLARVGIQKVWVGPWIHPDQTACIHCLQERLRMNLAARALAHLPPEEQQGTAFQIETLGGAIPPSSFLRLAQGIRRAPTHSGNPTELLVLPVTNDQVEAHVETRVKAHNVFRLPHCAVCGDLDLSPPGAEVILRSVQCVGGSGGGLRAVEPADTLRRLKPMISPLTGVVRHVRKVPVEGTDQVHVYTANHAHCYNASGFRTVRADRRDHSGGKGITDQDARVSALCESVERFSSVYRGTEPLQTARQSDLAAPSLHPNELLLFSEAQFANREAWNAEVGGGFQWVPAPYHDEPMEWSPARSLLTGQIRMVPSALVYLGFEGKGKQFCRGDSNGLASGNTLEEAVLQGFLELAERDAVALWWYNRARRPAVDLSTFPDSRVRKVEALYPSLRRNLWVLDLTSDLGIPTFAALSSIEDSEMEDIIFGFGAHLDPDIALLRALSELNQMLPTIQRTPEERRKQLLPAFSDAIEWWETAKLEDHPYLLPALETPPTTRAQHRSPPRSDLLDAVQDCLARAGSVGLDVLVHDLTRPDVGFPVARVFVPGLRHFWRRLGPGRLYDVPGALGWVPAPTPEDAINPVSLFV